MTPVMTPQYLAQAPANWGYELGPINTQNAFDLLAMFQEMEATYPLTFASLFSGNDPNAPAVSVLGFIVYDLAWMHTPGAIPTVDEFLDKWADFLYLLETTGDPE